MKIKVRYDNTVTTLEVPEEDFTLMIDIDYQSRLDAADDKNAVAPRTPQEIMDEQFNKPDYNSWHKFDRHRGNSKTPFRKDDEAEDETDAMDKFADWPDTENLDRQFEYDALCEKIRQALKPDYAEMVIAICIDDKSVDEYAALIGEKPNTVSKRFVRAKKKIKTIFEKTSYLGSSQGYEVEGNSSNKTLGGNS